MTLFSFYHNLKYSRIHKSYQVECYWWRISDSFNLIHFSIATPNQIVVLFINLILPYALLLKSYSIYFNELLFTASLLLPLTMKLSAVIVHSQLPIYHHLKTLLTKGYHMIHSMIFDSSSFAYHLHYSSEPILKLPYILTTSFIRLRIRTTLLLKCVMSILWGLGIVKVTFISNLYYK